MAVKFPIDTLSSILEVKQLPQKPSLDLNDVDLTSLNCNQKVGDNFFNQVLMLDFLL